MLGKLYEKQLQDAAAWEHMHENFDYFYNCFDIAMHCFSLLIVLIFNGILHMYKRKFWKKCFKEYIMDFVRKAFLKLLIVFYTPFQTLLHVLPRK